MAAPRFVMLGGFLGAGKTTTIARLARHYQCQGLRVGIVTNDQAPDLVDTNSLRAQGFDVGEVAGSCFCCNFNALTDTVEGLGAGRLPDVVIAEPVGSCTDLVATVVRPLQELYSTPFEIAPYGVILKPSHGSRILRNLPNSGFSPQAAYIFRKQLEESDFVIVNRVDQLASEEVETLAELIAEQYPGRPVVRMSARTGVGFEELCEQLERTSEMAGGRHMEVDYDVYAEGEAELGWLNAELTVSAPRPFPLDALLLDVVDRLRGAFLAEGAEPAHLKVSGTAGGALGVANVVSSFTPTELSVPSGRLDSLAAVIVNARVALAPERLAELVRGHGVAAATALDGVAEFGDLRSFRPGRPVPTHRIA